MKTEVQDYNKQIENINNYINGFAEKMKNKDALGALSYFAEFSGMKPHEFQRELLSQIAPEVERRAIMSPEELKNEGVTSTKRVSSQTTRVCARTISEEQALKELELEIADVQEAHSISDSEFENAYQELVDSEYEGDINPQAVAEYYMHSEASPQSG